MKNRLLALIASSALTLPMFSAMNMYVKQKDGSIVTFSVDNVAEVYYGEANSQIVETPAVEASSSDLKYFILNDNECEVTGFINGSANIVVPAKVVINGQTYTVTRIGEEAFEDEVRINTVTLPNTITSIGTSAFEGCENLKKINIPSSVTRIEGDAFEDCENLGNVELPNGLTFIGWGAFDGCSSFTSINIPSSVKTIEGEAFDNCDKLEPGLLIYANGIKCYGWVGNTAKCESVVIPEGVTEIGESAFNFHESDNNFVSVEIPSTVTHIGDEAFYYCTLLQNVTIPASVQSIGYRAFCGCKNADIVVENTSDAISFYSYNGDENYVEVGMEASKAFEECKSVTFKNAVYGQVGTPASELQVVAGKKYTATNQNVTFDFTVLSVEGSYLTKNQVVRFEIDGIEYVLSDAGTSYLMWNGNGGFECVNKVVADANAKDIVMILACANSSADYTITSATSNTTLYIKGAIETLFVEKNNTSSVLPVVEGNNKIQVSAGGIYSVINGNKSFKFMVKSVAGSYIDRNQVVTIEIIGYNGVELTLSDVESSYLMFDGSEFYTASTARAKVDVQDIVAYLAGASSSADYTICSPKLNDTMRALGATESLFSESSSQIGQGTDDENDKVDESSEARIQVQQGGKYYASNPLINFYFEVVDVEGTLEDKNQMVKLIIDGYEYQLSDKGTSYLIWENGSFFTVNKADADANAERVVMVLSSANSTANYTLASGTTNSTLIRNGVHKTVFSVDNREKEIEEIVAEQALTEIQVVTAGKYAASNEVKSLSFKVNSVEGSYTSKNQVVVIEIDGEEFKLSDAGDSYLMWTGSYFVTANTATAKANAKNLVLMLACANSSADYTITSASVNDTMRQLGATKTLFAKK